MSDPTWVTKLTTRCLERRNVTPQRVAEGRNNLVTEAHGLPGFGLLSLFGFGSSGYSPVRTAQAKPNVTTRAPSVWRRVV